MVEKISVGEYLLQRLTELGVKDVFGVPGDFNIDLVGMIDDNSDINWIGDCNELNAGYAADGYARINGFGALLTTYGPGELSAVNAIAGAYSEHVAVIKIAGSPALSKIQQKLPLHHTLLNGHYDQSYQIYRQITAAAACLDFNNPGETIDQVLSQCIEQRLPVYLQIPQDVLFHEIPRPQGSLITKNSDDIPFDNLPAIVSRIASARQPIFLIGELVARFGLSKEIKQFFHDSGYPYVVSWGAKGAVNETEANFAGMYAGIFSSKDVADFVESSDCVIALGWLECEVNLGVFSAEIKAEQRINFELDQVILDGKVSTNINFPAAIKRLITALPRYHGTLPTYFPHYEYKKDLLLQTEIEHENLIFQLSQFLQEDDILILETGTISFTCGYYKLPDNAKIISSINWASIGFALGATTGACCAHNKTAGRIILVVGDGSLQMTAQAISTMLRYNLNPIILVLNNGGYTVERVFLGENANYNDVANWDYTLLPKVFGCDSYASMKVQNDAELVRALASSREDSRMAIIEVAMDKHKQPKALLEGIPNWGKKKGV